VPPEAVILDGSDGLAEGLRALAGMLGDDAPPETGDTTPQ
jgi:hypothetical protein